MRDVPRDLDRIFKAYDVRGVVPDDLDVELARRIGAAFARWTRRLEHRRRARLPPVLARARRRARRRRHVDRACDVVDLGLASTDLLYFASGSLDMPGIMLTASHNPPQYNGMKFCLAGARPVGEETGLRDIRAHGRARAGAGRRAIAGPCEHRDLLDDYVEHVLSFVDVDAMRPLTVVADTANGMGGLVVPAVLARLPVTLHHLFPELDGTFPNHPADPIDPENQRDLKAAVLEHGADIGLAFDGDADRVFLVDERAQDVSGSLRHRARGERDARARARRDDRLQPDLLVDRARGDPRARRASRSAPGSGTRSSSR